MTNSWDEFSKALAQPLPRRESLRRLGAVFTATILAPLGTGFARGGPPPKQPDPCKAFCKCSSKKAQNQCLNACNACNQDPGQLAGGCGDYFCCGAGQYSCGRYCSDLANDPYNCGACGFACSEARLNEYGVCIDGSCAYPCIEGAILCDGVCTNVPWDPNNCGTCGNVCGGSTPYCNQGVCSRCRPGLTLCGDYCADLDSEFSNCGACGWVCESGQYCSGGVCVYNDPYNPDPGPAP